MLTVLRCDNPVELWLLALKVYCPKQAQNQLIFTLMNMFSNNPVLFCPVCMFSHSWKFFLKMLDVPVYCTFFYGLSSNQPVIVLGQISNWHSALFAAFYY